MDKRSKKIKFSEQETLSFVKEYLKSPCLWSLTHPGYKNKAIKLEKYQELYLKFKNVANGIDDVKNKIRILRTTYKQEENKVNSSFLDTTTEQIYTPRLAWFGLMKETFDSGKIKSFKKESKVSKQSIEPIVPKDEDAENFYYVQESSDHFEDVEEEDESYQDDEPESYQIETEVEEEKQILIEEYDEYEPPAKKSATEDEKSDLFVNEQEQFVENIRYNSFIKNSERSRKSVENQISTATVPLKDNKPKSSNEMYLLSLLETFDSLSPQQSLRAKFKIQQILLEISCET